MRLLLIGGGETVETVYFLGRLFAGRGDRVTIINPDPDEAHMLARRVRATVIVGDGSDPAVLEEAGARRADVLLSLLAYDPDNLVACQIARELYGVPRTLALVNDPDNEEVFRRLGITELFSATRILGSLIEGQTLSEEITHLFPAAEGRRHVTDVELPAQAPAAGQRLQDLALPPDTLVAAILRDEAIIVPAGDTQLQAGDHLILITRPESRDAAVQALAGQRG
jgi:trk system potassium uptake protein TrkA